MVNKDILRKIFVYGANYAARPISNAISAGTNLGNPWAAISLAFLDAASKKNSLVNRTIKLGTGIGFAIPTVMNLIEIAKGEYSALLDLPFNASMAYTCFKDAQNAYTAENTNIVKDIKGLADGQVSGPVF